MPIIARVIVPWIREDAESGPVNRPDIPTGFPDGTSFEDITHTDSRELPCNPNGVILLATLPDGAALDLLAAHTGDDAILHAEDRPDPGPEGEEIAPAKLRFALAEAKPSGAKRTKMLDMLAAVGFDKAELATEIKAGVEAKGIEEAIRSRLEFATKDEAIKAADERREAARAEAAEVAIRDAGR